MIEHPNLKSKDLIAKMKEREYFMKIYSMIPMLIIGFLCILSLIILMLTSTTRTLPWWGVGIYLIMMFVMVLSTLWPGFIIANYFWNRKEKKKKENEQNQTL